MSGSWNEDMDDELLWCDTPEHYREFILVKDLPKCETIDLPLNMQTILSWVMWHVANDKIPQYKVGLMLETWISVKKEAHNPYSYPQGTFVLWNTKNDDTIHLYKPSNVKLLLAGRFHITHDHAPSHIVKDIPYCPNCRGLAYAGLVEYAETDYHIISHCGCYDPDHNKNKDDTYLKTTPKRTGCTVILDEIFDPTMWDFTDPGHWAWEASGLSNPCSEIVLMDAQLSTLKF